MNVRLLRSTPIAASPALPATPRMRVARVPRSLPLLLVLLTAAASVVTLDAQAPRKGYKLLQTFQERFTLEYPSKDWEVVAGGTSSLMALTHKKREAAVVIEYQPLRLELAPSEIDEHFAKLEVEPVTARQAGATGVAVRLVDIGPAKVIVVDFSRKGISGGPEHVRQYSFPIGKHLYRLVCSSPSASFGKYEPVFTVMAETFRVAAGAAAPTSE